MSKLISPPSPPVSEYDDYEYSLYTPGTTLNYTCILHYEYPECPECGRVMSDYWSLQKHMFIYHDLMFSYV